MQNGAGRIRSNARISAAATSARSPPDRAASSWGRFPGSFTENSTPVCSIFDGEVNSMRASPPPNRSVNIELKAEFIASKVVMNSSCSWFCRSCPSVWRFLAAPSRSSICCFASSTRVCSDSYSAGANGLIGPSVSSMRRSSDIRRSR